MGQPRTRKVIFHSFGFKGFVRVTKTDSLKDVRRLIHENVDDHMIPKGDWVFSLDDVQVGLKQEEGEMAWEDVLDENAKVVLVQKTFPLKRKYPPAASVCEEHTTSESHIGKIPTRTNHKAKNTSGGQECSVTEIVQSSPSFSVCRSSSHVLSDGQTTALIQFIKKMACLWAQEQQEMGNHNIFYWNIFSNDAMKSIASYCPTSHEELIALGVLGEAKRKEYGERLINAIQRFLENNDISLEYIGSKRPAKRAKLETEGG